MQNNIAKKSKRVLGGLIDLLVCCAVLTTLGAVFGDANVASSQNGSMAINLSGPSFYFGCLLIIIGFAFLEFKYGKTPGKYICKTKVVGEIDNTSISFNQALIRNLLRFIDGILLYLVGFIIMAIDKRNQRLGDMAARTIVVND